MLEHLEPIAVALLVAVTAVVFYRLGRSER